MKDDCKYGWPDIHERVRFCPDTGKICHNPNERPSPKQEKLEEQVKPFKRPKRNE